MRTFDDIIPPSKRSAPPAPPPPGPRPAVAPRRGRFPYLILITALVVIAATAAILEFFSGAKIVITPAMASQTVESSFSAGPAGDMPFTLLSAVKTATTTIPATGSKQASGTASGTITVYNSQAKPQTLVANTRFATASGLIFKITKSIAVPAGSTSKPGQVSATVVASASGPNYNIGPSSFTVPGLAGTPEATAVYAHSTATMAGGSAGAVPVVDRATETAAVSTLQASLESQVNGLLAGQVPQGYTLLPGAATTTYRELAPATSAEPGKADIVLEADVVGIALPSIGLASAIASSTLQGGSATLGPGTSLAVTPTSPFPSTDTDSWSFELSGNAALISKVDPTQIATAVAGKTKQEAQVALQNYPEVAHAILILRPFWRQSFPQDPGSITVVVGSPASQ